MDKGSSYREEFYYTGVVAPGEIAGVIIPKFVNGFPDIGNQKDISLAAGQTLTADFFIGESFSQLKEIIIQGNYDKLKSSDDVTNIPLKNLENPQVYSVVPKELLTEQIITDVQQAFQNVPGATCWRLGVAFNNISGERYWNAAYKATA